MTQALAQAPVRPDDHFWRKRVVNRLALNEKMNLPLIKGLSDYYAGSTNFSEREGMVAALINGIKEGKYVAYDPDNWKQTLNYEALSRRMQDFEQALIADEAEWEDDISEGEEEIFKEAEDEWVWVDEGPADETDTWGSPFETAPETAAAEGPYQPDLAPYEQVIHMVEDWVFDKNRSKMEQRIDFFEVVWVDPSGTLPEKVLARFMWSDVRDQLALCPWKTRHNDAEMRSVAQAFEMRIFHSFLISVGGEPIRTLAEAEIRRQELIEFEHHLWSY